MRACVFWISATTICSVPGMNIYANVNYTLITHYNLKFPLVISCQHNILLNVFNILAVLW